MNKTTERKKKKYIKPPLTSHSIDYHDKYMHTFLTNRVTKSKKLKVFNIEQNKY